ncbi:MAG: LysR family transcriptional regulator [Gracilibacteraceae bacterium]|jgi:DNA-binding transcriptional LysR family regulator|nr:LysR family transcriptional regulator [Gracilibacteraceae bacterium]
MRTEHLRIFYEVAQAKSMAAASEALFVSPQNISKIIRQLETELNTILFERTRYGVHLTQNGRKLFDEAKVIVERLDNIQVTFNPLAVKTAELPTNPLNLTVAYQSAGALRPILNRLAAEFPKAPIRVTESDSADFSAVLTERTQPALLTLNMRRDRQTIMAFVDAYETFYCAENRLYVYVNKANPLAGEQHISLRTLAPLPLALYQSDPQKPAVIRRSVESTGIALLSRYISNSSAYCFALLKSNLAVCLDTLSWSRNFSAPDMETIALIPLKVPITLADLLFIPRAAARPPIIQRMVNMLSDFYGRSFYEIIKS